MNKHPIISVIIPIYNSEKYLKEAMDSLVNQTFKEIEIICINDGSTDNSLNILKKYAKKDNRIKIYTKKNQGCLAYTLNYALDKVSKYSKYIARMDSDDICELNRFQEQYNFMEKNKDIDISGSFMKIINKNEVWEVPEKVTLYNILKKHNDLSHPTVIFKKSFLEKHNIRYSITKLEDKELWMRCAIIYNAKIGNIQKELLNYRILENSLSNDPNKKAVIKNLLKITSIKYINILKKNNNKLYIKYKLECLKNAFKPFKVIKNKIIFKIKILNITIFKIKTKNNKQNYFILGIKFFSKKV